MPEAEVVQKIIWLVLLVAFVAVEGLTMGLVSIWFAFGALAALLAVQLGGGGIWVQLFLFAAVSLVCLAAVRPLAKKLLAPKGPPTNAGSIIGREGRVVEDVDNIQGRGAVVIGGITWTARSEDGSPIAAGTPVKVLRIEGVKVYVEYAKEEIKWTT